MRLGGGSWWNWNDVETLKLKVMVGEMEEHKVEEVQELEWVHLDNQEGVVAVVAAAVETVVALEPLVV